MATLNLAAYKPSSGQAVSASPISNAFTAIEAAANSIDNTQFAAGRIFDATKLIEASSVQRIADSTAGGAVASIDFTSISANYAHLLVTGFCRCDNAATQGINVRINNDSAANYDHQNLQGNVAAASAAEAFGNTFISLGVIPGTGATANFFGGFAAFIPQYAGTTGNKIVVACFMNKVSNASGGVVVGMFGGGWRTTATAVNRLTFLAGAGNLIAGSRITVYGLG